MLDASNYDPRPLHVRITEALKRYPLGIGTKDLAEILGDDKPTVSAMVSKMAIYGDRIEKIGPSYGQGVKWKLKCASRP